MNRLLVPLVLLAVGVTAIVISNRSDEDVVVPEATPMTVVSTPLLSVRRVPDALVDPISTKMLQLQLADVVARSPELTCLGVREGTRNLYRHQMDLGLIPASNQKLITSTAMLLERGPDFRYTTRALAPGGIVDGVVTGNLYLVGEGDPILATPDYLASFEEQPQIHTPIEDLAQMLVDQGLVRVDGAIVGVETRFDQERYVETWAPRLIEQQQSGPLSALMINDGFEQFPPVDQPEALPTPAADPAQHAAAVFGGILQGRGVTISGGARSLGEGEEVGEVSELATLVSPPLSEILNQLNTQSDNTTAELIVKELGIARSGVGTTLEGTNAIVEILAENGLNILEIPPRDGSGLDEGNRLSCDQIMEILEFNGRNSVIAASLPIAGQTGTLRKRYVDSLVDGNLRAKTGTLASATALSGFVDAADGRSLTFTYVANPDVVSIELLQVQDSLGLALAGYPAGPSADEISPEPVSSWSPSGESGG
jgi:D-alanyl-D-alanine carboxypeptidase/D-alanyl-D-alanine-endopeptidase (penicillin-binding protein 4)